MRYFLNVRTIDTLLIDDEGDDFPDLGEACNYALQVAAELAREYPRQPGNQWTIVPLALEVWTSSGRWSFAPRSIRPARLARRYGAFCAPAIR